MMGEKEKIQAGCASFDTHAQYFCCLADFLGLERAYPTPLGT
jgi:hypothetical protein